MLNRKQMRTQLHQLVGRWLLTEEVKELEALADRLGVTLHWQRYNFRDNKCVALADRRPLAAQHTAARRPSEEPCY